AHALCPLALESTLSVGFLRASGRAVAAGGPGALAAGLAAPVLARPAALVQCAGVRRPDRRRRADLLRRLQDAGRPGRRGSRPAADDAITAAASAAEIFVKIALYNLTTTTRLTGGVESFVWDLSRELARRGHQVTIIG